MSAAARRNLDAAIKLEEASRQVAASYLFGIAAECAIKAMISELGLSLPKERAEDPRYAHFPELLTLLRDQMSGRRSGGLLRYVEDQNFFQGWSIKIRYSDGKNFNSNWLKSWSQQARDVVGLLFVPIQFAMLILIVEKLARVVAANLRP
ncbi:hypothetical protein AOQ73_16795 [Bradyrhizobium pachyrhizi]|nr:hypothetical protein AOQ73_16795 [Bradyrhizobium pachyrhizi]